MTKYAEEKELYLRKTILFHRVKDARLVEWMEQQRNASEAVRQTLHICLGDLPGGAQPDSGARAQVDPESLRRVLEEALATHLADVRQVVDNALQSLAVVTLAASKPAPNAEAEDALANLIMMDADI